MELVLKVLNEYDILSNPIKNGISSKKVLYELTKSYLKEHESYYFDSLSSKEQDDYIKESIPKYINIHSGNLEKKIKQRNLEIRNVIHNFVSNKDNESYYKLMYFLSSLNNHLVNGSKVNTEWISTTTCFDDIFKYYDMQDNHQVAVCLLNTNGVYNEETLVVDVSLKEKITQMGCFGNKINKDDLDNFIKMINESPEFERSANNLFNEYIFQKTDSKFMGFNFANSSHEISIFNHISSDNIKSILESLQIDLIRANYFNTDFLSLPISVQKNELLRFKSKLSELVKKSNNPFIMYIFDELYLKNRNINYLINSEDEKERIIRVRNKIISNAVNIPSKMIKK